MSNRRENLEMRKTLIQALQTELRRVRKIIGWSATDFGAMLGLSKRSLSRLESGETQMSVTQYVAIRSLIDNYVDMHPENRLVYVLSRELDCGLAGGWETVIFDRKPTGFML